MINEENLNKIYNGIIEGRDLTTKELNGYGFTSKDLSDLINEGVLERVSRGHYSLVSVENLYSYGKQLFHTKQFDKAKICFEKCYGIDSSHYDTCLKLFFISIYKHDYEMAFQYFDSFYSIDNPDHNFYLYLLYMLTEVPNKYREFAKIIKFEDVAINDEKYGDIEVQNKIRLLALNEKFKYALNLLNKSMSINKNNIFEYPVIKTLLNNVLTTHWKNRTKLLKLIRNNNYLDAINYLKQRALYRELTEYDSYILLLLEKLVEIKENNIIPEKNIFSTDNLFNAIDGNNYELALSLMDEYADERDLHSERNSLYLVLAKINDEIKRIEKKENIVVDNEELSKIEVVQNSSNSYMDIFGYLMKHDFDNSYVCLKGYLNSIGKSEYDFLLINLIKLSCLENDSAFIKPMMVLTQLNQGTFQFDVSKYIGDFYIALSQSKYDEARVYLDIISGAKGVADVAMISSVLEQALDKLEGKKTNQVGILEKKTEIVNHSIEQEVVKESNFSEKYENIEIKKEDNLVKKTNVDKKIILNKDYDDVSFIQGKLEDLYRDGIVLLRPMDSERRKGIHSVVEGISDVASFSIGSNNERRVVLRYNPYVDDSVSIKQSIIDGNQAYKQGDYTECIENYRQVLAYKNPKAYVYSKLGLAYMKSWNTELAIDYLTVATELSKLEDNKYDFTELIGRLSGKFDPDEEKKPNVRMNTSEFVDDMHDYYDVPNMEDIFNLVDSGISIEEACNMYNLTDEDIKIVYLIFAKNCYAEERYSSGDNYFKVVEKSPNKTDFVKWLLNEVRRNKKFYKNRVEVLQKQYMLN